MNKPILYSNATETDKDVLACGLYAHGDLETRLGYDVIYPEYKEVEGSRRILVGLEKDGIYDVIIQHMDEQIEAKLFYWQADEWDRGLAVLESDVEGMAYAHRLYDKRSRML